MDKMIKIVDGVPSAYSVSQLRKDHPELERMEITPDLAAEYSCAFVFMRPRPSCDNVLQRVVEGDAELIGEVWHQTWNIEQLGENQAATNVRGVRDAMMQEMERDDTVLVLGEDVGVDGGVFRATDGLIERFGPDRVIDTPLAESSKAR